MRQETGRSKVLFVCVSENYTKRKLHTGHMFLQLYVTDIPRSLLQLNYEFFLLLVVVLLCWRRLKYLCKTE